MDPTSAPPVAPPPNHADTPLKGGKNGTSVLGGPKEISARLSSFMDSRKGPGESDKSQLPLPDKKKELAPDKTKETEKPPVVDKDKTSNTPPDKTAPDKEKVGSDGLTKEERAQVVEFKKRAETAEARLKELEAKASEGEASKKELAEIKKLEKERQIDYDRNEREIAAIRIQGSKKYQETIAKPMHLLTTKIEEIAKGCNLDADEVFSTISMTDLVKRNQGLEKYLESMDALTRGTFTQTVNSLLDLEPKAAKIMAEAREAWQALQQEEKEAAELESQQKRETYLKASEEVWKEVKSRLPALSKLDPKVEAKIREKADNFDLATASQDVVAFAAQSAYSIGEMQGAIDKLEEENDQLKASIKRLGGERLGPGDGATSKETEKPQLQGGNSGSRFEAWRTGSRR